MAVLNLPLTLWILSFTSIPFIECQEIEPPTFIFEPPSNVYTFPGIEVTVDCLAAGSPSPTIQWTIELGKQSAETYVLRKVHQNGSATFNLSGLSMTKARCAAKNSFGIVYSRVVRIKTVSFAKWSPTLSVLSFVEEAFGIFECQVPRSLQDSVQRLFWWRTQKGEYFPEPLSGNFDTRYISVKEFLYIRNPAQRDTEFNFYCEVQMVISNETRRSESVTPSFKGNRQNASAPRVFTQWMRSYSSFQLGEIAVLVCPASGSPYPIFRWGLRSLNGPVEEIINSSRLSVNNGVIYFNPILLQDKGRYVCSAANNFGEDSTEINVVVKDRFFVTIYPNRKEVRDQQSVSFECQTSIPANNIFWIKNGETLKSERTVQINGTSLIIKKARRDDVGIYQCVAEIDGKVEQATATLLLKDFPPEFESIFTNMLVHPGASVSLKCSSIGNPSPEILWYFNDGPIEERFYNQLVIASFRNKSGIVTSYINITFAQIENGGEYSCVAENGFGRIVHKAALNVLGRPATFSSIVNITAAYGRTLSVRCPISGYPVSNIRWSYSNNQLHRGSSAGDVFVSDNGTLIIQSVKKEDHSGDFYCEGDDSIGVTIKRRVAVIVSKPPEIAPFAFPPKMEIGTRLQVTCSVFSGDFPLTISWMKDGLPISLDLGIREHNTPLASSLLFMEVRHTHAGAYTCKASNHAASAMFSAVLQVTVPPKWSREPTNMEAVEHDRVQIACLAIGYPEPIVSWYKLVGGDTKTLINVLSLSGSISILNNGSLLFSNVEECDEGEYQCEVENGTKAKLSKRIRFNVRVPPSPLIVPKNISVLVGKALTLFCDIRGDVPISISWTINGVSTVADKWKFRVSEVKINRKTRSKLNVISFSRDDEGLYLCLASNVLGRSAIPFYVTALALPGIPRSLQLESRDSRSITLRWSTPFVSSEASDEYIIQWQIKESGLWLNNTSLVTNFTILNLIPATVYLVRVASSSSLGISLFTEVLHVETLLEAPDSSPSNLQVSFITEISFKLSWKPLAKETDLKILGYIVSWAGTKDKVMLSLSVPADLTSTLIQNLEPSTYYKLSVAAFNSEGIGPNSSTLAMTQSKDEIPVVTDVSCSSINSQTLRVRWKAPEVYDGILSYRVYYRKVESKSGSDTKRSTNLETILHGLLPGTTFAVRVAVARRKDVGSTSKAIYCTTNQETPKKIKFFSVAPISETEVLCVWSASKLTTSDVYYQIRYTEHGKDQDISLTIYPKSNEVEISYHIPNLHPGLKYDISVQIISSVGTSPKSSIVTVVPSSKARPKFLSTNHIVRAKALSMISLPCRASGRETREASWFFDPGNLTIHNHRRISTNSANELVIKELLSEDSGNYTCVTILDGIKHSVTHILEVLDIPKRPTLTLKLVTEDSVTVSWTAEHGGILAVTDFILAYREVGGLWEEREIEPSVAEYTLQHLRCGTAHEIKLSAVNDIGISQPSPLVLTKSLGNVAKPPKPENMVYRLRNDPYLVLYNWQDGGCRVGRFSVKARQRYSTQWINLYDIRIPSSYYLLNTIPGTVSLWHLHPNQHDLLQIMAHSDAGIETIEYEILFKENITSGLALFSNTDNSGSMFSSIEQSFNLQILIPVLSGIVTTIACTSLCVMFAYLRKMRNLKNSSSSRTVSNVNIHERSNANPIYQRAGTSEADLSSRSLDNHLEDYDINPYATFSLADVKGHWYDLHQDSGTISTAVTATLDEEYGLAKDTIRSNPPPYRTIASYGAASFENDDRQRYFNPVFSERQCEPRERDLCKESISVISPPSFHSKHLYTISKDNDTDSSERRHIFSLPKKSGRLKQWNNVTEIEEYSINV